MTTTMGQLHDMHSSKAVATYLRGRCVVEMASQKS